MYLPLRSARRRQHPAKWSELSGRRGRAARTSVGASSRPRQPVAWFSRVGTDGIDHNLRRFNAKDDGEREAVDPNTATPSLFGLPCIRVLLDTREHGVHRNAELSPSAYARSFVILDLVEKLSPRLGIKPQSLHGASRLASSMTSSASYRTASPRSYAATRRWISARQASSTFGSGASSRESRSRSTRCSRSCADRARPRWASSATVSGMTWLQVKPDLTAWGNAGAVWLPASPAFAAALVAAAAALADGQARSADPAAAAPAWRCDGFDKPTRGNAMLVAPGRPRWVVSRPAPPRTRKAAPAARARAGPCRAPRTEPGATNVRTRRPASQVPRPVRATGRSDRRAWCSRAAP